MDMLIASGSELSVDLRGTGKIMHACHKGVEYYTSISRKQSNEDLARFFYPNPFNVCFVVKSV